MEPEVDVIDFVILGIGETEDVDKCLFGKDCLCFVTTIVESE